MRRFWMLGALIAVSVGCETVPQLDRKEGVPFRVGGSGGGSGGSAPDEFSADVPGTVTSGTSTVDAGVLTAGIWDDNQNYDWFERYRASLTQTSGLPAFSAEEQEAARSASENRAPRSALDVALVIDTTGSMGDEITYLQAEFRAISDAVTAQFPNVPQRWALIAYRDTSDDYVLSGADFGTSVTWFQGELAKLSAGGGGDFPEAPDQALAWAASHLTWNPAADSARLVFWVADAPHHNDKAGPMADAIRELRNRGVQVFPVASSGIDELTEYTMRASAQLTLGRYVFLTDDSGVGGEHKEPSVPCFVVTRLDQGMLRVIATELSGTHVAADPATVLRSEGNPQDGVCSLPDGEATLF